MKSHRSQIDPVEGIIAEALDRTGYGYVRNVVPPGNPIRRLDFYVPALDVYIECKQFATPRLHDQINGTNNVIVICGIPAARAFASFIGASQPIEVAL